ncbi:MAG TPA: HAD family hydrolase [Candidatus Limnocylindrales bacterium]|nr:HAD family hydrolase [Candidatus Limnocylindrales bacterium]
MTIRAVVFDVGETLVDETRVWSEWADWFGIPRLTFLAVCGAVIERGGDHREPFEIFRPGLDLGEEVAKRDLAGVVDLIAADDVYPDAADCLRELRDAGYRIGVVGNQPARAEAALANLGLPIDLLATSSSWGVQKPDPRFFERIAMELDLPAAEIAYVGDRVDNDVRPAAAAGMRAIFIRRGPWAWIQAPRDDPPEAALTIATLMELPAALAALRG